MKENDLSVNHREQKILRGWQGGRDSLYNAERFKAVWIAHDTTLHERDKSREEEENNKETETERETETETERETERKTERQRDRERERERQRKRHKESLLFMRF